MAAPKYGGGQNEYQNFKCPNCKEVFIVPSFMPIMEVDTKTNMIHRVIYDVEEVKHNCDTNLDELPEHEWFLWMNMSARKKGKVLKKMLQQ